MADSADAIAADLRSADSDRYLATLFAPAEKRRALQALYAFNVEIAGIREKVTQPLAGEMRIQWWRDQLQAAARGAADAEQGHPVLSSLNEAITVYALPLQAFDNYLEARIFDLYDDPMPSKTHLEGYLGETSSALLQLAALILDPVSAAGFADAAGHGGCAQGMVAILRALPAHRRRGQVYMPGDILNATGLSAQEFNAAGDGRSGMAVAALAAVARQHLRDFEKAAKAVPPGLRPAFLPLSIVGHYLDRIEADPQRCLSAPPSVSPLCRHLSLLGRALRGW
ncbi:phytoene/squalene synthase family protein [Limoniibacter endophyticus]|uniref:Phytoene synthase n=1 Tax=Limoniibacter endophyticus TaxID=1565040 RepID=A0A8J3GFH3_9HYPH|nr:phytoene/squalene synthase family protein [Limoniibacter endophyticus]GHC62751.1 phytoene synthase [Limoniibacter endophyticus]